MLSFRRHQPTIRRKFVRFTVAITAAIISVFLIYSHSSIDAFSLGCRTLPTAQLFNHQDSKDPNSYAVIHTRNPLRPFSRLQTKGGNDDDNIISKNDIDACGSTGYDGNSDNSGSDSSSPFFAESEGRFQMTDRVSPVLEQQSQQQQVDDNESNEDMKTVERNGSDSSSPFFAKREDQFQMTNRVSPVLEQQSQQQQVDDNESNEDMKTVERNGSDSSSPFFAKREDQFQMTNRVSSFLEQQSQQPQVDDNVLDIYSKTVETQTTTEKRLNDRSSFTPVQRIPIKGQFTSNAEEENANYNSGRPISLLKRAKNEEFKELIDSSQALGDETQEIFDKSMKTVMEAIALAKGLPSKVNETVEKIQQILKDVQDISIKVNEFVQETKQSVEKTVEKTQQTIKDVQDIPKKVTRSLEDTKQSISKKQEPMREAVSSAKVLFGLERPSLRSRWYRMIPMTPQEEALDLAGNAILATGKMALWVGKGVGSLAWKGTRYVYNNTIGPAVEEAWNEQLDSLNNSVERTATLVKNTPSRVISAVVPSTQRDQASVSSSASIRNQPTNIQRGPPSVDNASAKNQPTRIQRVPASVSSSAKTRPTPIQQRSPASVSSSREKLKTDRKSEHKKENKGKSKFHSAKPVVKFVVKSPEELNKEIEDAQKLAKEISDAMDVAERAMKMKPNSEFDDPMIEIEKLKSIGRIGTVVPLPLPASIVEEKATLVEKRNKRKTEINDVLSRFKPKPGKTLDGIDAQLKEAQSLAKEIADALEMAEQSLMTASADSSNSNESKVDKATESKTL
jgi:hypothetical protein